MAKVFIEESTLTAIGDAIRGKEGTTDLVPVIDMAMRIADLPSEGGGGGDSEEYFSDKDLVLSGYLPSNTFNGAINTKILQKEGTRIKFNNIAEARFLFNEVGQLDLSHLEMSLDNANFTAMFNRASVTALPKLTGSISVAQQYPFGDCYYLRYLPEGMDTLDYSQLHEAVDWMESFFYNCYSLREIPTAVLSQLWNKGTDYILYRYGFLNCYVLDELVGIPVYENLEPYNQFDCTFDYCHRLKEVTFVTNPDGTAKVANWKNQVIDLATNYTTPADYKNTLRYNSGITEDKLVINDEQYQRLKNDPDWTAGARVYARYNRASAVNTINSLPDTSAYLAANGGTNTIKFTQEGNNTDAGSPTDLSEAEIAVAAAKGWTVVFSTHE